MSTMYIRVKKDGFIYPYSEILAENPGCEVVPEEVAFPERFMPESAKQTKRTKKINLFTEDIPDKPASAPTELSHEASRGLP